MLTVENTVHKQCNTWSEVTHPLGSRSRLETCRVHCIYGV